MQSNAIKYVLLLFGIIIFEMFSRCAVATSKIPIREIDRPINMPAGIKQVDIDLRWNYSGRWELSPYLAYAVTDKITFISLPFPIIQYQFYGSNSYIGDTVKTSNIAIGLIAGIKGSSSIQNYEIRPQLGIIGKKILNKNFWLSFDAGSETVNSDVLLGYAASSIGYQLLKRNSIIVGLNVEAFKTISNSIDSIVWSENTGKSGLFIGAPIQWKLNLTNWMSFKLNFEPEIKYENSKIVGLQPSTNCLLGFNW